MSAAKGSPLCYYHKDQILHNFCRSESCCLPLCSKCIQTHIDEHDRQGTIPIIQSFDDTVDYALKHLKQDINALTEQLDQLKKCGPQPNMAHYVETINKSRQIIIKRLNQYFDSLQTKIEQALTAKHQRLIFSNSQSLEDTIKKMLDELNNYKEDIEIRQHIPSVIKFYADAKSQEARHLVAEVRLRKETFRDTLPFLNIDLTNLEIFFDKIMAFQVPREPLKPMILTKELASSPGRTQRLSMSIMGRVGNSRRRSPEHLRLVRFSNIGSLQNQLRELRTHRVNKTERTHYEY